MEVCQALAVVGASLPTSESACAIGESMPMRLNSRREANYRSASIASLLATFEGSRCSESRDKVFGLLSLVEPKVRDVIPVVYEKNMFNVYKDIVWAVASCSYEDKLLTCHFSQLLQRTLDGPFDAESLAEGKTAETASSFSRVPHRSELLCIIGVPVGKILLIETPQNVTIGQAIRRRKRLDALKELFQPETSSMDDRNIHLAAAIKQLENIRPKCLHWIPDSYSHASRFVQTDINRQSPTDPTSQSRLCDPTMFITTNGDIGVGTCCIRDDDLLCQF